MSQKVIGIFAHSGVSEKFYRMDLNNNAMQTTINCVKNGFRILRQTNGDAIDAVETAVNFMESSGNTNSGRGSVKQNDGMQRMDASIMDSSLACGCVASLRGYENPISLAKLFIKDANGHVFYAFDYASKIADANALKLLNPKAMRPSLQYEKQFNSSQNGKESDTVGAVALDSTGKLAAGTSTGGRSHCEAGRIGDSSIIGAGTYCNKSAAVSNTGFGEWIIRLNTAKRIVDLVQFNQFPPQAAVDRAGNEYALACDKTVGSICLDNRGRWGVGIVGSAMRWGGIIQIEEKTPILYYGCARGEIFKEELKIE